MMSYMHPKDAKRPPPTSIGPCMASCIVSASLLKLIPRKMPNLGDKSSSLQLNGAGKAPLDCRLNMFEIHSFSWQLKQFMSKRIKLVNNIRFLRNLVV